MNFLTNSWYSYYYCDYLINFDYYDNNYDCSYNLDLDFYFDNYLDNGWYYISFYCFIY